MHLCRIEADGDVHLGLVDEHGRILDLTAREGALGTDVVSAQRLARERGLPLAELLRQVAAAPGPVLGDLPLQVPVAVTEVWAAGVTYERSRQARLEEAQGSGSFYDRVYTAERPELFFKADARRVVGPERSLRLRSDSRWMVPEPELALVLGEEGEIVGYTVGNDLTARDIEGENPLYLPQAKVFRACCALGPVVRLAGPGFDPYRLAVRMTIRRAGQVVFAGETSTSHLVRRLDELVQWLARDQELLPGTVLLTGTGIVPPAEVALACGDVVSITVEGIGTLTNPVAGP